MQMIKWKGREELDAYYIRYIAENASFVMLTLGAVDRSSFISSFSKHTMWLRFPQSRPIPKLLLLFEALNAVTSTLLSILVVVLMVETLLNTALRSHTLPVNTTLAIQPLTLTVNQGLQSDQAESANGSDR